MAVFERTVESTWGGGLRADVKAGRFQLIVDEPETVGGTDLGPQPTELLLASIASCFTLAIAYSAKRLAVELRDLSVEATGTYDGPRFRAIRVVSRLDCDESQVERLIAAAERVCYVTNTIRSDVKFTFEAVTRRPSQG